MDARTRIKHYPLPFWSRGEPHTSRYTVYRVAFIWFGDLPLRDMAQFEGDLEPRSDGPLLPLEFSRFDPDGRVRVVLTPGVPEVRALWHSAYACRFWERDEVARAFATTPSNVAGAPRMPGVEARSLHTWRRGCEHRDVLLYAGVPRARHMGDVLGPDEAVAHIQSLTEGQRDLARRCVEHTHPQIDTPVRRALEAAFGWTRPHLPDPG